MLLQLALSRESGRVGKSWKSRVLRAHETAGSNPAILTHMTPVWPNGKAAAC